jgi:hypothetical protein
VFGTSSDDRAAISRVSATRGTALWTTTYDEGPGVDHRAVSDGKDTIHVYGSFEQRIAFSSALRFETHGDLDIYLAELDAATGAIRGARHIASPGTDTTRALLPGACPILAGAVQDPITVGADLLGIAPDVKGSFVATACP